VGIAEKFEVGDYDLRGPDFETLLVGPITATTIDAARLVRSDFDNGFPNWAMYRCALAGDDHLRQGLRQWCVAFATAYLFTGGCRKPSDDLGCLVGWDAYAFLVHRRWIVSEDDVEDIGSVTANTYRKVRGAVAKRLQAALDEYWVRMQIGYRQAVLMERRADSTPAPSRYSSGRGFDPREDLSGSGNYVATPRGSGC
jgi:hypothetical protein